jgi:hypothetical protein
MNPFNFSFYTEDSIIFNACFQMMKSVAGFLIHLSHGRLHGRHQTLVMMSVKPGEAASKKLNNLEASELIQIFSSQHLEDRHIPTTG